MYTFKFTTQCVCGLLFELSLLLLLIIIIIIVIKDDKLTESFEHQTKYVVLPILLLWPQSPYAADVNFFLSELMKHDTGQV